MKLDAVHRENQAALDARPWIAPGYEFQPVSVHDDRLHELRHRLPYFGYVDISVEGVRPFVMLSSNDDLVVQTYFWFGPNAFETLSMLIWRRLVRQSRRVLDVGAFTGVYALLAAVANPDAEVHAFEPVPRMFGRLLDNLIVNRLGVRVYSHDVALSDRARSTWINLARGPLTLSAGSSLEDRPDRPAETRREVETIRLSDVVDGFDCAKIDVEGHEHAVVAGIDPSTIERDRPTLLVEVFDADHLARLLEMLPGYSFAVIDDQQMAYHVNESDLLDHGYRNVLLRFGPPHAIVDFCEPLAREL